MYGQALDKEELVTLPTRVLSVKNLDDIRLIESHGSEGRYCALSYCWGPDGKKNLKTVRENLENHLRGIRFLDLPKTFQEASIITHELGIEYLWIDSLCIVQGDRDDWSRESKVMGSIYENAFLMISATGSSDPAQGCFVVERPDDAPAASISVKADGEHAIHLNLRLMSQAETRPSFGPLGSRGWALQERYLSRRKLFFMPGGISWACKTVERDEPDIEVDLGIYNYDSWSAFLAEYTSSELTIVTDRLPAIQGIVEKMKEAQEGRYFYGVWDTGLVEQCLWISGIDVALTDALPGMPSWSWARTRGEKSWSITNQDVISEARANIHNDRPETLSVSGVLRQIGQSTRVKYCCIKDYTNFMDGLGLQLLGPGSEEYSIMDLYYKKRRCYALRDRSYKVLGFGVFDALRASRCVFASSALVERRSTLPSEV
ncbi:hypothetical protein O1611_g6078 [Lasiodiplodia mahajangana]|uniref:Uncharacterized protein n=1 Tax=Lasiodiplodia mahajangana TaxID=1108764 RepID=A0ACC2JJU4_9PEZI|nr:hypothetical protein O1611_g6078 [Lasiodiplodia mahajangana]